MGFVVFITASLNGNLTGIRRRFEMPVFPGDYQVV